MLPQTLEYFKSQSQSGIKLLLKVSENEFRNSTYLHSTRFHIPAAVRTGKSGPTCRHLFVKGSCQGILALHEAIPGSGLISWRRDKEVGWNYVSIIKWRIYSVIVERINNFRPITMSREK